MKQNTAKKIGKLLPAKSLILRNSVGTAKQGRKKYELTTSKVGAPIVRSEQTGKWFTISWQDILNAAIDLGIDK